MPKLFDIKFPGACRTLPDGFWSATDVWVKKAHVVNKRLCGVKESDSKDVDPEDLRLLLDDPELFPNVLLFLSSGASPAHAHGSAKPWSSSVRTFIPKVNCYGTSLHKEVVLKGESFTCMDAVPVLFILQCLFFLCVCSADFNRQRVTFIPFEEDAEGKVSLKKHNIYQIQLCSHDSEEW